MYRYIYRLVSPEPYQVQVCIYRQYPLFPIPKRLGWEGPQGLDRRRSFVLKRKAGETLGELYEKANSRGQTAVDEQMRADELAARYNQEAANYAPRGGSTCDESG